MAVMANESSTSGTQGPAPSTNIVGRVKGFYHDIISEMSKVSWPTREEVKASTAIVFTMIAVLSAVIAVLDLVFRNIVVIAFRLI
jgi:preprotein translocase subunit SecE